MLTLDEAITSARAIQRDLDAGRLTVPYPKEVKASLVEIMMTISDYCTTPERTTEVARRLDAPDLPW